MSYVTGGLGYVIPFLIVLTVLVFVHELGHYLVARRAGVRVEVFSIGFGPELFGRFDRAGTRWRLSAIPFGGYVKMFGDADAASTPGENVPTMTPEEQAVSFHHKSLGARAAILAAGPGANFLFAIVVLSIFYMTAGEPFTPPVVSQVLPESAAAAGGIEAGDRFVRIGGNTVTRFEDVSEAVQLNTGTPMDIVVDRDGHEQSLTITPQIKDKVDRFGNHNRYGVLGVQHDGAASYVRRDPLTAVGHAGAYTWDTSVNILKGIGQIISGARTTDELGGPIQIAKLSGDVAQLGIVPMLSLMAFLSINLGLVNLFPIPVLDGGHLLFYAAEALLGRPLGRRIQEVGFRVGLALVLTLIVFVTWNDIRRLVWRS